MMRTILFGHPVLWWSVVVGLVGLFAFVCASVGYLLAERRLGHRIGEANALEPPSRRTRP